MDISSFYSLIKKSNSPTKPTSIEGSFFINRICHSAGCGYLFIFVRTTKLLFRIQTDNQNSVILDYSLSKPYITINGYTKGKPLKAMLIPLNS